MSIFTLDWFKSKKSKELEKLKKEIESSTHEFLKNINEVKLNRLSVEQKPYKKLQIVNDTITVVFVDGSIVTKQDCNMGDFEKIKSCKSEHEVLKVFKTEVTAPVDSKAESLKLKVSESYKTLEGLDDFEINGNSIKLKGINRTIPTLLLDKFITVVNKWRNAPSEDLQDACNNDVEYVALKRFFMWCCLNPRAEVSDELYRFLIDNNFRITKQGFFVALRNVVSLQNENGSNEQVQFISNAYNKVKAVWKKNPANYEVFKNDKGEYVISNTKPIYDIHLGNLKELYINLPNMAENRFTDDWTRTFDIRIGKIVDMPISECNWSTQDCAAAGLHFTSDQINYVGCGDTSVLMLINPMKVVGIGRHKGRCYEYLPIMTVPCEEATKILHDLDFDTIDLDEFYIETQLESLAESVHENFASEATKHEFNIPAISTTDIGNIVSILNEMKNDIGSRVQKIV